MRRLFAFSMLLAGFLMTDPAPTPSLTSLRTAAAGNTCDFGEPEYAASCANVNGNRGLLGRADNGVYGYHNTGNEGFLGGPFYGVYGEHANGPLGYLGGGSTGAVGEHQNGNYGTLGSSAYGAYGQHNNGSWGALGRSGYAVYGEHVSDNRGWIGSYGFGVLGENSNGNYGSLGTNGVGASGRHFNDNVGVLGSVDVGAYGWHNNGNYGSLGSINIAVYGEHFNGNVGALGESDYAVFGSAEAPDFAGYFAGNVHVTGTLSGGTAASKVDHPLDPANRYLSHSFVESPEMKTVYDGTVTTDDEGFATVMLPAYFEALNRDFRYGLTVIGTFARAIVAEKIQGNQFVIRTDEPHVEVSWQVTGIRHDAWAEQNRLVVEENKPPEERGRYLHPRLYGQPEVLRIGLVAEDQASVDHEAMRRQIDAERQRMGEERRRMQAEHERLQPQRLHRPPPPDIRP